MLFRGKTVFIMHMLANLDLLFKKDYVSLKRHDQGYNTFNFLIKCLHKENQFALKLNVYIVQVSQEASLSLLAFAII